MTIPEPVKELSRTEVWFLFFFLSFLYIQKVIEWIEIKAMYIIH